MVDGKRQVMQKDTVSLGANPTRIQFQFLPGTNNLHAAMRVRYRLDGYENQWHDNPCKMLMGLRFLNRSNEQFAGTYFDVSGDSAGWSQSLVTSPLTHRRELVICPPNTGCFWVVISSAGPPATVGTYVIANLKVFKMATNGAWVAAMPPLNDDLGISSDDTVRNWQQDGGHPSMAKVVKIGSPPQKALAIVDTDGTTHAEWHTAPAVSPRAGPGNQLLLEWDEMFSMGVCDVTSASYDKLPAGKYNLQVEYFDVLGRPTGIQGRLNVLVPRSLWLQPWFWGASGVAFAAFMVKVGRYLHSRRMLREFNHLKVQRALEQERLRIARDIHDDLGARLTRVSLKSALAKRKFNSPDLPPAVSDEFEQISVLCRDLVTSLYASVWSVNPKNDNLNALGDFLCQSVLRLSEQAQLTCQLEVPDLPGEIEISSSARHDIALAVTEAVHNVIKHAKATELCLNAGFEAGILSILVKDNGCGFDPAHTSNGNGLDNMRNRLANIGGTCLIESQPGRGTAVRMQVSVEKISLRGCKIETN